MQQLKLLPFYQDITHSISATGITVLKKGSFKRRHKGSNLITETPKEGIILKSSYVKCPGDIPKVKRKAKKSVVVIQSGSKKIKLVRDYYVNKKIISHRIRQYINQMKGFKQLYFWTVTFPEGTSDDTAFICLNKWLTRLRFERMLKSYLWVSERQKNGTIHYHIAIPHRMDIKRANRYMRACLFTCIDSNIIKFSREAAKNYNGVDISKDRKSKRITNFAQRKKARSLLTYITKYISKNTQSYTHLAWHCSRDFSNLITSFNLTLSEFLQSVLVTSISYERPFENDFIIFYKWLKDPPGAVMHYFSKVNQYVQKLITI